MKKQLFIILMLTMIVGLNQSFAQAVGGSLPQAINCAGNAYNPIAGVPYDYSATIDPALGSAYWYATNATTFMSGGTRPAGIELLAGGVVVAAATNYMDNAIGDASPTTTNITWTSAGLEANTPAAATDPPTLFVVVEYNAPASGCANNVKVYPVRPINAFVVDIMNMTQGATPGPAGYGTLVESCYAGVQSAVYNPAPAPNGGIDYDFGTNVIYFEVVAANFTGSYTPSFQISGLNGSQTADIDWGVAVGAYPTNVVMGGINGTTYTSPAVNTNLTNTSTGVSIYVRMTIHNDTWEGVVNPFDNITLAVDAITGTAADPIDDVNNATCVLNTPFQDLSNQHLNKRPTVTEVAPNVFLPVNP